MSSNKRSFNTVLAGHHYEVPVYKIVPNVGIEETGEVLSLKFVRGTKKAEDTDTPDIVQQHGPLEGTLHEHLLSVMIEDLKLKAKEVPSRETSLVITKLEEARHWLEERQKAREAEGVLGTYKPHRN